jgi:class 3 adenylate cyclase/tetratricopeptide (TPR) repeat protein
VQRKTVTVLFCDVAGSTALGESIDPEALRGLLARYFERMKAVIERHGGSVEKFIGDAVMAVFGVPITHEDDALRAVRAATQMLDALPELGVHVRIGVNTGEVVTGTEERLATGDAVNVAARLEQAAKADEVLVGEATFALVRDAVEVEPVEPLALKGKTEPVTAYRLLRVHEAVERRHEALFVGRGRELALLRETWARVRGERRCELMTIVGDAGVGKTRLVTEALASIEARVARGRCLSYGEGITYWPVVEVLKQLDALPADQAAAAAVRSLLGETNGPTTAEEIAWGFRKTLEQVAAQRPLAVVFDDIQWAQETFLELIEHVALLSAGAPILLLCMARPELTEVRPTWPVTLRLEPLPDNDIEVLIPTRITGELREKITRAAGGNPLFIWEMLAIAGEATGEVVVPPTVQALLATRLDQLDGAERRVLECGAVEGEIFHRGAVQALAPEDTKVTPRLAALVRKKLIRPDEPQLAGEDGFRFRHLLIRDAAYDALPKATRSDLHERFARWLEQRAFGVVELDEIVGYHLEQACRYRAELGRMFDGELAASAGDRLTAAGRRSYIRADHRAAVNLLERAAALVPAGELNVALELDIADALFWAGRGEDALRRAESFTKRATAARARVAELCARIKEGVLRTWLEPEGATDRLARLIEEAMPVFQSAGDDVALHAGYAALGQVANMRAQMDVLVDAYERAAVHARRAGLPNDFLVWRHMGRFYGGTPLAELLAWEEIHGAALRNVWSRGRRAEALAMLGRFDEARTLLAELRAELADRGEQFALAAVIADNAVSVELLAGDPAGAVAFGEEGCRILEKQRQTSVLSTLAGRLAQALYALGRLDEADAWANRGSELGASDDAITQLLWRQVKAKVHARHGAHAEAERLAQEAVAIGERTEMLDAQGDAYADLAEVLSRAGRASDAGKAFGQSLARYEQKGNLVKAGRVRAQLAANLSSGPAT